MNMADLAERVAAEHGVTNEHVRTILDSASAANICPWRLKHRGQR
jgi:hypothetical protein